MMAALPALVLALVLAVAALAEAQCAWVLWQHQLVTTAATGGQGKR